MEVQLTRRPAAACCHRLFLHTPSTVSASRSRPVLATAEGATAAATRQNGGVRTKATASRTRRALNIAPHTSFLSGPGGSSSSSSNTHIIFNPPASAPTVYHTPFKFLPKTDPRRRAELPANIFAQSTTIQYNANSITSDAAAAPRGAQQPASEAAEVLPTVGHAAPKKYHLSPEDVEEMRRLRYADPETNSISALAQRFGCSKLFVIFCCPPTEEQRTKMREAAARVQARWGPRKAAAVAERARRRQMLLAGEL